MNTERQGARRRWIGLANVVPRPGNESLGNADGAFVAVVGDARSTEGFLDLVSQELGSLEFEVVSLEDVELLRKRKLSHDLPDELLQAITYISAFSPVAFSSFFPYDA